MPEHHEQVALFQLIDKYRRRYPVLNRIYAVPNGGQRHKAVAAKLKAEGVKSGVWDIHVAVPRKGYHGAFIEMKYAKNRLSPNQLEWRKLNQADYFMPDPCYTSLEAWNVLCDYLELNLP